MNTKSLFSLLSLVAFLTAPLTSHAWGRRGHAMVGETAAYLTSSEPGAAPLKGHSYDLGYYCNVPDFFWKKPATYELERPQHYMDMEIFERAFAKKPEIKSPLHLTRHEFEAQFPEVDAKAGRAWWRIRELTDRLDKITQALKAPDAPKGVDRHPLQEKWIVTAGALCHYVGDMSMPLHMSENHDGQLTDQKGVHAYYEDTCVDYLFPQLQGKVMEQAKAQWPAFQKKNAGKPLLEMLEDLGKISSSQVQPLLAIDKHSQRENVKATCAKYEPMIVRGLVHSGLLLAEIYRRELGWTFDDNKFYFFAGEPEYIPPGEEAKADVKAK